MVVCVCVLFFLEPLSSDLGSLHGLPGNHSPLISARTSHVATVLRQLLELVDKHWNGSGSLLLNKKFLGKWMHFQLLEKNSDLGSSLCSYKSHQAPLSCKENCSHEPLLKFLSGMVIDKSVFFLIIFPVGFINTLPSCTNCFVPSVTFLVISG